MSKEKKIYIQGKELSDDALEQVAGGDGMCPSTTTMRCTNTQCGHTERWLGVFVNYTAECPICHQHTFQSE